MFDWIVNVICSILLFVFLCFLPFILMGCFYFIYYRYVKLMKPPKREFESNVKKELILKRIFIDFPRRFVLDRLTSDPNEFKEYGFHLFVGEQGSGKTVSVAQFLIELKKQYPLCKIATNFDYKMQDSEISSWQNLIFNNNGIYGQADVIDEVQNWFSSNQSKDFPPEMIQEITQQRKQRKIFIGTTQRFERMAKPLREQVNYIYYPLTIAGCLTIVRVCKPTVDSDGQLKKLRTVRYYFFVHSDEVRNCFDTYKKIEKQATDGFISDRNVGSDIYINNVIESKQKRKK